MLFFSFDEFDPKMFGISEPEAAKMDPQQRYILECVHMALEDGGLMRKDIQETRTGVYIGRSIIKHLIIRERTFNFKRGGVCLFP